MKNFIKSSFKTLTGYLITLLIFCVFLYVFLSITKDNYSTWVPLYSFINFLLLFAILYSDFKQLAIKEKRPQYNLNPYPIKGLVYGAIGFVPIILLIAAYGIFTLVAAPMRPVDVAVKVLLGPIYWIVRLLGMSIIGYVGAIISVPVLCMLGYLAGFYGFELSKYTKKKVPEKQKEFKKSPWNPTVSASPRPKKKKKKVQ
jgi:hypothetical protein